MGLMKSYMVYDEEENDYVVEIPNEILEELGWKIGDSLTMELRDDTIVVRRVDKRESFDE